MKEREMKMAAFIEKYKKREKEVFSVFEKFSDKGFCLSMVASVIAYSDIRDYKETFNNYQAVRYLTPYVEKLGKNIVLSIVKYYLSNIERVDKNTYTDSEQVNYNSVVYTEKHTKYKLIKKGE
jgi:hypothetical protein